MNEGLQPRVPKDLTDEWEAIRELEHGGHSTPILLRNCRDGTEAVLKLLKAAEEPEARARLKREVKILKAINHPNIVRLISSNMRGRTPWYLTPKGTVLSEYWKERRSILPPATLFDEANAVITALLEGLHLFHTKGGVHRDIKPANVIVLQRDGKFIPVLIDFGIAYVSDEQRITNTDARPVANRLVAHPGAYYGKLSNPPPWWDCLGIAWLWGWMLMQGREPKHDRYDPRYHPFIDEPRCSRVKAVWSTVVVEDVAPRNAWEMLTLMERLGLVPRREKGEQDKHVKVIETLREVESRQLEQRAVKCRIIEAASAVLGQIYDAVRRVVRQIADEAKARGLPVTYSVQHESASSVIRNAPLMSPPAALQLLSIQCDGEPRRRFQVCLEIIYDPEPEIPGRDGADCYPFLFHLYVSHNTHKFSQFQFRYFHDRSGAIIFDSSQKSLINAKMRGGELNIAETISYWLAVGEFWSGL